jgi:hypothetical protein
MDKTQSVNTAHTSQCLPFSEINSPGCYVANGIGDLFRIPEDGVVTGRSPLIEIVSKTPRMVTKVSDDPWAPISRARQLAADADLYVNF